KLKGGGLPPPLPQIRAAYGPRDPSADSIGAMFGSSLEPVGLLALDVPRPLPLRSLSTSWSIRAFSFSRRSTSFSARAHRSLTGAPLVEPAAGVGAPEHLSLIVSSTALTFSFRSSRNEM